MKTVNTLLLICCVLLIYACGGDKKKTAEDQYGYSDESTPAKTEEPKEKSYNGIGEVKHVDLTEPLDEEMIKGGKMIFDMKCSACHKLTDQRVVGPGWAGVTNRRTPEWIMNMVTNVEIMLDADPQAQALLEECLVRMPNQHVSVGDARNILEFMRKNDVEQTGKRDEAAKK